MQLTTRPRRVAVLSRSRAAVMLSCALAASVALTACSNSAGSKGSAPSATPSAAVAEVPALHDMLPASIKASGTLRVATTPVNPPMDYVTNNQPNGLDVDMARAVGSVLGVKVEFSESALDGIIPGVLANRWDVMWPGMNDNPAREKQVTMVDYVRHAFSAAVPAGNPKKIKTLADFCGLTFGEVQGSVFQELIPTISKANCAAHGRPAIKVDTFPDNAGAFQAVAAGRIDAVLNAQELNAYQAQQSPRLEALNGIAISPTHYGIGILPTNTALINAIKGAVDELIKNGTYQDLLDKWKLGFMAIPQALVNHPAPVKS
jgi:polar amino acid transport system substrate-binding protein